MKGQLLMVIVLFIAVLGSALSVVSVKHLNRKLFVELQRLERERDAAQIEWGRLQLEHSTWATHDRIERIAGLRLDLHRPPSEAVILVTP